jgi:hemerythrin-like domain-containing protein
MAMTLPELQDSPLDLLRSCHAKVRQYATGLDRLVAAHAAGDPRAAEGAPPLARYFREAIPKHAADEDESLTPRLLRIAPHLRELLDRLEAEHREMKVLLPALCLDLDAIAAGGPIDTAAFATRAGTVTALLREHARLEETHWFSLVDTFPPEEQRQIRMEMAERRRP